MISIVLQFTTTLSCTVCCKSTIDSFTPFRFAIVYTLCEYKYSIHWKCYVLSMRNETQFERSHLPQLILLTLLDLLNGRNNIDEMGGVWIIPETFFSISFCMEWFFFISLTFWVCISLCLRSIGNFFFSDAEKFGIHINNFYCSIFSDAYFPT